MRKVALHILVLTLLAGCTDKGSDWSPYFESQYKKPYGTKVISEELEYLFPGSTLDEIKDRTDEYLDNNSFEYGCFAYINPTFYPDDAEYEKIANLLTNPNDVFISTQDQNASCFTTHGITVNYSNEEKFVLRLKNLITDDYKFTLPNRTPEATAYFERIPSYATILGTIEVAGKQQPNFIAIRNFNYSSTLLLHCQPHLYSNYHLLRNEDGRYAMNTMSYLTHTDYFLWDGYGTSRRYNTPKSDGDNESLLRYIYGSKSLTYALATLILLALLFFAVNYKRVIRAIPVLRSTKNNSLDYVTVIAALHESETNKIQAARYRANYVLDRIRDKYFLSTSELGEDFQKELAIKSEVQPQRLTALTYQLKKAKTINTMNSEDFREFNKVIEAAIHLIRLNQ